MRKAVVLVVALVIVAAIASAAFQDRSMSVTIEVYRTDDGPDVSHRVQKLVGYMPDSAKNATPTLGQLRVIRPQAGPSQIYQIQSMQTLHVYVIGETPEPMLFTFEPGWWGHPASLKISLANLPE